MSGRYGRRVTGSRGSRWMALRYAGTCKVCGTRVPAGTTAYYDSAARSITCAELACAESDGLTRDEWHGSPTSGGWAPARAASRVGDGYRRTVSEGADPGIVGWKGWRERASLLARPPRALGAVLAVRPKETGALPGDEVTMVGLSLREDRHGHGHCRRWESRLGPHGTRNRCPICRW